MSQTVLVIDDEPNHTTLAGFALMQEGFDVIAAANGPEGIEKAKQEKPDLIMLDIKMRDMNGYEVIRHLRTIPEIARVPVLFFTALYSQIDKHWAHALGVAGVIAKPADPLEIVSRVKNLLLCESEQVPEPAMCR